MEWFAIGIVVVAVFAYFRLRRRPADISMLPEHFVIVDLETTGLDPAKHEIIEIGAVRVHRNSTVHDTLQILVIPKRKIPQKITEITSITQEMIEKDGVPLASAMRDLVAFVADLRLVAYNAEFDMAFLHNAAAQCGLTIANPTSCALQMARRAWPGRKSYRLVDIAKDGGMQVAGAHRALLDCRLTLTVYGAAASKLRSIS